MDGWSTREDGTTDDETFLRGIARTDSAGMTDFLAIFPGYYISRTTHIHVTVQTNVTGKDSSYSVASVQHLGQLFFEEDLINSVYQEAPYRAHLSTLNRTTNAEDSLYLLFGQWKRILCSGFCFPARRIPERWSGRIYHDWRQHFCYTCRNHWW